MRMWVVLSMLATLALSVSSQAATDVVITPEQQYADEAYARGDYAAAMKQYLALAKEGDTFAQYRVSYMYLEGQGLTTDLVEAYAWAAVAARQGQMELLRYRDTVGSLVPEDQRRKAARTAEYYARKWGQDEADYEYGRTVRNEMRRCTGSRIGARCEDVESMDMPQFWAIAQAGGESSGGTAKASGATPTSVVHGTGTPRNVAYYQQLRDSLRMMNSAIGENAGRVEVHEMETPEDSSEAPVPKEESPPEGK